MKSFFNKINKNKVLYIVILFLLIYLPSTIYLPAESDRRLVVSTVGIDKLENQIQVSLLMVIPKSEGNIGNNYQLVAESGDSLSNALTKLGTQSGKSVSFAHCETIVVSNEILEDDLSKYLDFFIRTNNLTSNADIISTENAKDFLQANLTLAKEFSLSIKDILSNTEKTTGAKDYNIDSYFRSYTSKNNCFLLPFANLTTPKKDSENENSNEESGSGESSSADESSNQSSNEKKSPSSSGSSDGESSGKIINYVGDISILNKGKLVAKLNSPDNLGLDLLNNKITTKIFEIKNDYDESIQNADVSIEVLNKSVKKSMQFINNIPYITYDLKLFIKLDEIFQENFNEENLDTVFTIMHEKTLNKIQETVNESISNTIKLSKDTNTDIFDIVQFAYAFHNKDYKTYTSTKTDNDLIQDAVYLINYDFAVRN